MLKNLLNPDIEGILKKHGIKLSDELAVLEKRQQEFKKLKVMK